MDKFIKFENFEEDLTLLNKKLNFPEDIYKVFKSIINFLTLRPGKSIYYFAKVKAFYNFKKIIKQKKVK